MTWWSSHGRTVLTVAALWLVFNDPIDRWLPVPMPELVPGPTTTWLAELPLHDGRPDFAAAIDASDGDRLAAGAAGWQAVRDATKEAGLGGAIKQHRGQGRQSLLRGMPPATDTQPSGAADRDVILLAIAERLGPLPALAVPAKAYDQGGSGQVSLLRGPGELSALLLLVESCRRSGNAALAAGDAGRALAIAETLVRLASLMVGIDDVASHAGARRIRSQAWQLVLGSLAARIGDVKLTGEGAALLARSVPFPPADTAFRRNARLLALRHITGFDRSLREGTASGAAADLRTNYPPDVNEGLSQVNGWFDAVDRILPAVLDDAALNDLDTEILPELDGPSQPTLRLANTMLFNPPMAERRRAAAGWVAGACTEVATIGLRALCSATRAERNARRLLTDVLAVPVSSDPVSYAAALRQRLGSAAEAGGLLAVTVDGSAVVIRPTSDVPGISLLRIVLPSPP